MSSEVCLDDDHVKTRRPPSWHRVHFGVGVLVAVEMGWRQGSKILLRGMFITLHELCAPESLPLRPPRRLHDLI